ncbi:hypothetical protein KP509_21G004100 [Ceratopteris richardii]|uniref:DUF4005 domain-containing protein n=1 Tax=Ceratopteris richardii TaxID=49495 RepID=A0A8T2S916_CERRI|nr:hypothetical protein KP509_21G004100 [Ceratopteris richardii]KAH7314462.1 hypothetical protein KP509_21G004100 [Ceratopteris richardii]KAH7314465.1 hypothetical protein KP509_21G004100 [Ceratopteris richardii]
MGKKSAWLNAVKKAFSLSKDTSAQQDHQNPSDSKYIFSKDGERESFALQEKKSSFKERNRWSFRRSSRALEPSGDRLHVQTGTVIRSYEDVHNKGGHTGDLSYRPSNCTFEKAYANDQNKQALAVAVATVAAAEAAVAAAQAAAQVVKLTGHTRSGRSSNVTTPLSSKLPRKNLEELAAVRIQAAFRAYLARRTLRTLKGLARLQALTQGQVGQRQATATMRCMQALVRAQAAVRGRRTLRHCDDTDVLNLPSSLLQPSWEQCESRRSTEALTDMDMKDVNEETYKHDWDHSTQTKEQIQAKELSRQEASMKRERAMAYAFSQQMHTSGKCSSKTNDTAQMGWNWLERWIAARPWDNRRPSPRKEAACPPPSVAPFTQRQPSPLRRASAPATPAPISLRRCTTPRASSPSCPMSSTTPMIGHSYALSAARPPSNKFPATLGTHSLASSSLRDDVSIASFSGTPSYMAPTESARAKLRSHSTPKQRPAGPRRADTILRVDQTGTIPSSRKRLSFTNVYGGSGRNLLV